MSDIGLDAAKAAICSKYPILKDKLTQIVSADETQFDRKGEVQISQSDGNVSYKNVARFDMFVYIDKGGKNIDKSGFDSYLYDAKGFVELVNTNYVFLLPSDVYV